MSEQMCTDMLRDLRFSRSKTEPAIKKAIQNFVSAKARRVAVEDKIDLTSQYFMEVVGLCGKKPKLDFLDTLITLRANIARREAGLPDSRP